MLLALALAIALALWRAIGPRVLRTPRSGPALPLAAVALAL